MRERSERSEPLEEREWQLEQERRSDPLAQQQAERVAVVETHIGDLTLTDAAKQTEN